MVYRIKINEQWSKETEKRRPKVLWEVGIRKRSGTEQKIKDRRVDKKEKDRKGPLCRLYERLILDRRFSRSYDYGRSIVILC